MTSILKEIFVRRNLIRELVIKDLKVRYSRPTLGFFWAFLSPFLTALVFYLIFSIILQVKIEESNFLLYLMSAVFTWRFFQDSLLTAATSLVDNKNLIRESNFPSFLLPLSVVLANGINYLPSLCLLILVSCIALKGVSVFIILLPFILFIHLIITIGLSLLVSIFYVKWRDTRYVLEIVLQVLFYLTPAFYSLTVVKNSFSPFLFNLYINNPFVILLNLYRIAILRDFLKLVAQNFSFLAFFSLIVFASAVLFLGFYIYRLNKDTINDHLSY